MKLHNNNEYQNIKCRYEIHIGIFLSNSRVIKLQSFGVSVSAFRHHPRKIPGYTHIYACADCGMYPLAGESCAGTGSAASRL